MNNLINDSEKIQEIEISKISDFPQHPFKVVDDDKMDALIESIKQQGILVPAIVRLKEDGTYEMVSGHRRKHALSKIGIKTIKCIIKELNDDEAKILIVDSNIQREELLPSEKAFAYKMKLDAIKHQGVKSTCAPLVHKRGRPKSRDVIAGENNESAEQVRRYVRLTYLINEFLEMVDQNKIGFRTAVELSYLSKDNQYYIYNYYEANEVIPSLSQAITLKSYENDKRLTQERLDEILEEEKPNQREKLWIVVSSIKHYFPKDYSSEQIDKVVKDLLKDYKASWQKDKSAINEKDESNKVEFYHIR